jgi:DNA polymerase-1
MIQMAMVQIAREFKRKRLASRMIIQVHDELIFSVPEEEVPVVVEIATNILESVVELEIETPVAVEIGPSWGRLQSFTDWEAGH